MSLVRFRPEAPSADLAHLVERHLAKVEVAGSSPVIRSSKTLLKKGVFFYFLIRNLGSNGFEFPSSRIVVARRSTGSLLQLLALSHTTRKNNTQLFLLR